MIVPFVPPISTLEVEPSLPPNTISSFSDTSIEPSSVLASTVTFLSPEKFNVLSSGFTVIWLPLLSVAIQPAFTLSDTACN